MALAYWRFLAKRFPGCESLAEGPLTNIKRTGHFIGIGFHGRSEPDGDACYFAIEDPLERIDIDTDDDFLMAEAALSHFDFGFEIKRPGEARR